MPSWRWSATSAESEARTWCGSRTALGTARDDVVQLVWIPVRQPKQGSSRSRLALGDVSVRSGSMEVAPLVATVIESAFTGCMGAAGRAVLKNAAVRQLRVSPFFEIAVILGR